MDRPRYSLDVRLVASTLLGLLLLVWLFSVPFRLSRRGNELMEARFILGAAFLSLSILINTTPVLLSSSWWRCSLFDSLRALFGFLGCFSFSTVLDV
jgi:hypothetical protein